MGNILKFIDKQTDRQFDHGDSFELCKSCGDMGFSSVMIDGSSSVPQEYVNIINANGGKLPDAVGIPEEQLREASKSAVCKINIDSDSRLAMAAAIRKVFNEKPGEFDPRKYLGPARDEMKKLYEHKIVDVLGSNGKAE